MALVMDDSAAEENLSDDWYAVRRKGQVDVPHTMDVGEALVRLTYAFKKFLGQTQSSEDRVFRLALDHRTAEGTTRLQHRILIAQTRVPKDEELVTAMIQDVNASQFFDTLEEAVEWAFNRVAKMFQEYNDEFERDLKVEEESLNERKEDLLRLRRNLKEMGHFERIQASLPFTADETAQEN